MTHLTVEEIIEFVSFDKLSEETIALSTTVNEHIRVCSTCLEKVSSFQMVYDELCKIGNIADAKKSIYRLIDEGQLQELQANELNKAMQTFGETLVNDISR